MIDGETETDSPAALMAEFFDAVRHTSKGDDRAMLQLGVPRSVIYAGRARYGVSPITTQGRFYEPATDGAPAIILAEGTPIWAEIGWHVIDELIAFYLAEPRRYWVRRGSIDVLGEQAVFERRYDGRPLHLCRAPLSYLAHPGSACLLDWKTDPRDVFHGVAAIQCDTPELERRLRARFAEVSRPVIPVTIAPSLRRKVG